MPALRFAYFSTHKHLEKKQDTRTAIGSGEKRQRLERAVGQHSRGTPKYGDHATLKQKKGDVATARPKVAVARRGVCARQQRQDRWEVKTQEEI